MAHRFLEAAGIFVELKPDDQVIGISHDNHVAHGLAMSPSLGPEIKHVVQVNVGKALSRSHIASWKRRASLSSSNPMIRSSAYRTIITLPTASRCRRKRISHCWLTESKK